MSVTDPLESALTDLGGSIAYPPVPDLARSVIARIEARPAPRRRFGDGLWARAPRIAWVAAVVAALFAGALAFSPSREAIADFFGVDGLHIEFGGRAPEVVGRELDLGERIAFDEIAERVPFPVRVPASSRLGPPDEVYFGEPPPEGQLSFVYRAEDGLPPAPQTEVGVLFTQFRADLEGDFFKKGIYLDTSVRPVSVEGAEGYWIHGAPHVFTYRDAEGRFVEESARLAGDVLVWSKDGITYRLEAALPLAEMLDIAESLEPIDG